MAGEVTAAAAVSSSRRRKALARVLQILRSGRAALQGMSPGAALGAPAGMRPRLCRQPQLLLLLLLAPRLLWRGWAGAAGGAGEAGTGVDAGDRWGYL